MGNTFQQHRAHSVGILTSGRKYNGLSGHHPTRGTSWKNALITTRSEDASVSARSTGSNDESAEKSSCAQAKPTHEDGTTERTNDASIRFFICFTVYDTSLAGGGKNLATSIRHIPCDKIRYLPHDEGNEGQHLTAEVSEQRQPVLISPL